MATVSAKNNQCFTDAHEIKEKISQSLICRAKEKKTEISSNELGKVFIEARILSDEGYKEFCARLKGTYSDPFYEDLVKLIIGSFSGYFYSPLELNGELQKILKD